MMNATYVNTDERYGDAELVTISDYRELNPDGEFEERADGIYELVRITYGHNEWQRIAENAADPADVEDGYTEVGLHIPDDDDAVGL